MCQIFVAVSDHHQSDLLTLGHGPDGCLACALTGVLAAYGRPLKPAPTGSISRTFLCFLNFFLVYSILTPLLAVLTAAYVAVEAMRTAVMAAPGLTHLRPGRSGSAGDMACELLDMLSRNVRCVSVCVCPFGALSVLLLLPWTHSVSL